MAIAVVVVLGIALVFQQRHEVDLVEVLTPLCGRRRDLAIMPTSRLAVIGEYTGVIEAVDPATRWVTFARIEASPDGVAGMLSPDRLADAGVIADCIRWVQPAGQPRIDLV